MQAVGLDLFHAGGRDYLVMVDRYSGYPFVQCLASTTAAAVTPALAGWWELFGLPSVVRVDGGPQFRCQEFLTFCGERDIELETFSPYNPRSNGLAEAAVKNCKKLLLKCISGGDNYADALLEFRRRRGRLSPLPWRRRRKPGRKRVRRLWRELEPAVWKNSMKEMKCGCRIGSPGLGTRTQLCWGSAMAVLLSLSISQTPRRSRGGTNVFST